MSRALAGLTAQQISRDYTFVQIEKVQDQIDDVVVDSQYFKYNESTDATNIGRNTIDIDAQKTVVIGQDNEVIGDIDINNNIIIGSKNVVQGKNNYIMGSLNILENVDRNHIIEDNILITSGLTMDNLPNGTEGVIVLSAFQLNIADTVIPSGSIIIGNNTEPSDLALVQFGGANLNEPLPTAPLPGNPDAYIRIRYKDVNYKIPVFADDDNPNP